jgi:hypothetical protein
MAVFTVLTPPPGDGDAHERAERTLFLKDGFLLSAFLFTGLWLLAKRLWLAFAVFVALWAAIGFGGRAIGVHPLGLALAQMLIGLYLGLEGHALIERKLLRKGWRLAGVVEGKEIDQVARRFFEQAGALAARDAREAATATPGLQRSGQPPAPDYGVLGLFPDSQGRP